MDMVKTLQKSSPEQEGRWPWDLICSIWAYQVCSNDGPWLTLTYLRSRSNLLPINGFLFLKRGFFENC